jgi:hypothetical protein
LIFASFARLRRFVEWKNKVLGCIATFEATYNPRCLCGYRKSEHHAAGRFWHCDFEAAPEQADPWHPHLNVLAEGEYFPHEQLCQMWGVATDGRAKVVHISAVNNGFIDLEEGGTSKAARELVKYITKASDLVGNPVAVEQFLDAVYGRRLLRTYGTFYGLKLEEEAVGQDEVCPDCGTDEWVETSYIAPQQIAMDMKGVLRDKRRQVEIDQDIGRAVLFAPKTIPDKPLVDAGTFSRMRKSWDKNALGFDERHAQWQTAVDRVSAVKMNAIAGWGYSEFLSKLQGGNA